MPTNIILGEFEQFVLLTLLTLGEDGYALPLRHQLSKTAGRAVSRGALYRTLDRLEDKRFVQWELEDKVPHRGGHPRRRFRVTPAGLRTLRASRRTLQRLWNEVEEVLG